KVVELALLTYRAGSRRCLVEVAPMTDQHRPIPVEYQRDIAIWADEACTTRPAEHHGRLPTTVQQQNRLLPLVQARAHELLERFAQQRGVALSKLHSQIDDLDAGQGKRSRRTVAAVDDRRAHALRQHEAAVVGTVGMPGRF